MRSKIQLFGIILLTFIFFLPFNVFAGNGSLSISGSSSVQPGSNFSLSVVASSSESNLMGIGGTVSSSNASCVQVNSISKSIPGSDAQGMRFSYLDMSGFSGSKTIVTLNVTAVGSSCSADISITGPTLSFTDGANLKPGTVTKRINVTAPLSTNNNLKSLTVSEGSLSPAFSANNTNYSLNVSEDVSSITINAVPEDGNSTVSGAGAKTVKYGSNKFTITVKAQNGATKNYNVTVNRKDNRSNNANLKSLSVSNGTLSPAFNSGTTNYKMEVPFETSKLNIKAEAEDANAKVSINNPDLVAEKTTTVTIKVTAQNETSKTYTIQVTRGKDPNKALNKDNNLLSLIPSVGMISPAFNPDKTNYYIYLPYEIENISFDYEVSDKTYATVERSGEEKLKPNSGNKFTFKVTAEDKSSKTYTVVVYRAKNPEEIDSSSDTESSSTLRLKSLTLKNGKLTEKFNSEKMTYTFTKKKNFSYTYELFDENTFATTYETDKAIYIVLESESGEMVVYCLHQKGTNVALIILIVIVILLLLLCAYLLLDKFKLGKNKKAK